MCEGYGSPKRRCHKHRHADDCADHLLVGQPSAEHKLLFLMVQRKDTMAYTDLVRGVYPSNKSEQIEVLSHFIEELTCNEREKLLMRPFQQIWDDLWSSHGRSHSHECQAAKEKFERLQLRELFEKIPCRWTQQEFGFPKGRRNHNEDNRQCAMREFCEESGYLPSEIELIPQRSFEERFRGTNNIEYRHVYYLARIKDNAKGPRFNEHSLHQAAEIRRVVWLTYEQCLQIMRPYDKAKLATFKRIHDSLKHLCCSYIL